MLRTLSRESLSRQLGIREENLCSDDDDADLNRTDVGINAGINIDAAICVGVDVCVDVDVGDRISGLY